MSGSSSFLFLNGNITEACANFLTKGAMNFNASQIAEELTQAMSLGFQDFSMSRQGLECEGKVIREMTCSAAGGAEQSATFFSDQKISLLMESFLYAYQKLFDAACPAKQSKSGHEMPVWGWLGIVIAGIFLCAGFCQGLRQERRREREREREGLLAPNRTNALIPHPGNLSSGQGSAFRPIDGPLGGGPAV